MVATMIMLTRPPPIRMPRCGNSQLPMKAPTMPMAMSPIRPKPPPATISPASHPAIRPTSKMTSKLSPDKYISPSRPVQGKTTQIQSAPTKRGSRDLVPRPDLFSRHQRERVHEGVHRRLAVVRLQCRGGDDAAALAVHDDDAPAAQPVAVVDELFRR